MSSNSLSKQEIEKIVHDAQHEFWAKVAEMCPHITTGDFSPESTVRFDEACRVAVTTWIKNNTPE